MPAIKKILLPVDIAHPHEEVLPMLNELIPLNGAHVHLLYVREELPSMENALRSLGGPEDFQKEVEAKATAVLSTMAEQVKAFGANVTQEITAGPAAMMIEQVAKDEGYTVTVLPPGAKHGLDRYVLGRVSGKVVRHAPGLVLLLRADDTFKMNHVLIGVDGSEQSLGALRQAVAVFGLNERNVRVTVLNVVSVHPLMTMISPVSYISAIEGNLKMSGEAILAEAEKELVKLGVKNVEMKQLEGRTADKMMTMAKEENVSLIVVGALGKSSVEQFVMGSTSSSLAEHSACPVAVFKPR